MAADRFIVSKASVNPVAYELVGSPVPPNVFILILTGLFTCIVPDCIYDEISIPDP